MAHIESDGVAEEATGQLRAALAVAAQLASQAARARQQMAERAAQRDTQIAREYRDRLAAEHAAARVQFAPVHEASWWDQAQARDVARAYEAAVTWRGDDPEARRAEERIQTELRDRYGVDVNETSADPAAVQSAIAFREQFQEENERARGDQGEALTLATEAEVLDAAADLEGAAERSELHAEVADLEQSADCSWDSAERRDAHAAALEERGEVTAAGAWKQADVDQARHPRAAVQGGKKRSPRSRTNSPALRQQERGR